MSRFCADVRCNLPANHRGECSERGQSKRRARTEKADTETWYEIEYSRQGEDDWFRDGCHHDRLPVTMATEEFKYRVVRVTVTREVMTDSKTEEKEK